jgi:trans-2-enoyl-CoA reductase
MRSDVQEKNSELWQAATETADLGDLEGYRSDFIIFSVGFDGVDYEAEQTEMVGVNSIA